MCKYFIYEFRDDQKMSLGSFSRKITEVFNVTPNIWKLATAPGVSTAKVLQFAMREMRSDDPRQRARWWMYRSAKAPPQ